MVLCFFKFIATECFESFGVFILTIALSAGLERCPVVFNPVVVRTLVFSTLVFRTPVFSPVEDVRG